eukprot:749826-Hanusia_phi.AAC.5
MSLLELLKVTLKLNQPSSSSPSSTPSSLYSTSPSATHSSSSSSSSVLLLSLCYSPPPPPLLPLLLLPLCTPPLPLLLSPPLPPLSRILPVLRPSLACHLHGDDLLLPPVEVSQQLVVADQPCSSMTPRLPQQRTPASPLSFWFSLLRLSRSCFALVSASLQAPRHVTPQTPHVTTSGLTGPPRARLARP